MQFSGDLPPFDHLPQSGSSSSAEGSYTGMFCYIHKVRDGRNVYYFANSADEPVDATVRLRGRLALEWWDPRIGEIVAVETTVSTEAGAGVGAASDGLPRVSGTAFCGKGGYETGFAIVAGSSHRTVADVPVLAD